MAGAFTEIKDLVDRGVISPIGENEPITTSKVASLEAGAGLPPVIPEGMRAISVRVNEVVGVAGFVVPGTLVDVLVTATASSGPDEAMTRTVVSKVTVLTAGTKYDQEKSKAGEPIRPRSSRWLSCPRMGNASRWPRTKERSHSRCAIRWTWIRRTPRASGWRR